MGGVTFLTLLMVAVCSGMCILPLLAGERAAQERSGLFGSRTRDRRLARERSAASVAAAAAVAADASAMALDAAAERLARRRPVIDRLDEAGRGWWLLGLADGTVLLVQARSSRPLRRLRRRIGMLPVTLVGVSRRGDRARLELEAQHRSVTVDALVVTIAH